MRTLKYIDENGEETKVEWTPEMERDVESLHDINFKKEMAEALVKEVEFKDAQRI